MGDGALLEFGSIVEAVQFAIEVQLAIRERNAATPEDRHVYRIGINLGDVIVEEDDIYGDGVNVVARLETLAEPGGICLSRAARDQVRDRMEITLENLGEIEVKNIARPVRCFAVRLDDGSERPQQTKTERKPALALPDKPLPSPSAPRQHERGPEQDTSTDGMVEASLRGCHGWTSLFVTHHQPWSISWTW